MTGSVKMIFKPAHKLVVPVEEPHVEVGNIDEEVVFLEVKSPAPTGVWFAHAQQQSILRAADRPDRSDVLINGVGLSAAKTAAKVRAGIESGRKHRTVSKPRIFLY
jgi:hypothetical protein